MALTANKEVDHYVDQELRSFRVGEGEHVFKGGLVGLTAGGYGRPLTAGDAFAGIAYEETDNTGGSDGDASVRVYTLGDFALSLSGAAAADVGRPVFASADDALTFGGAGNSYIGIVQDVISTGQVIVRIDPMRRQIRTISHAVDNLGAGVDIAARAIRAFEMDGWIVSARIVNQDTAASGIDDGNTCVITVASDAGTVATETFDSTTTFPAVNARHDLGAIVNADIGTGSVLTLAVTCGATADPGAFLVEVDYA